MPRPDPSNAKTEPILAPIQIRLGRYRKAVSWSVIGGAAVVALGWGGRLVLSERQALIDRDAALSRRLDEQEALRIEADRATQARIGKCETQVATGNAVLEAIRVQLTEIQAENRTQAHRLDARIAEIQVILMQQGRRP